MRYLNIFLLEWKHFVRSPFKIIALVLFVIASVYGLHKGAKLQQEQSAEIEKIEKKVQENRQELIDNYYSKGNFKNENRPWIDYSEPFWAIWNSNAYHFKNPSPAMVYSIGQSEQYGFYKRVTFWASPYDADLAEEIANPERLQTGTLDFSFALLFLLPLVLLVLIYNLKSKETEEGFMPLIEVQMPKKNTWLLLRASFYILLFFVIIIVLLIYGASLTNVFAQAKGVFGQMLLYTALYLVFWSVIYYFILLKGKSILGNTLKMSAVYLLFAFIVPAVVHQSLSIMHPANLMIDFIDVRDQEDEFRNLPDSVYIGKLVKLFPEIELSPVYQDSTKIKSARGDSASALANLLKKESIETVEKENQLKNNFIESTFWFNPVSFFQNRLNSISKTHFNDYQTYRNDIQELIDKQIRVMVLDTWNEKKVDKKTYENYFKMFTK